MHLIRRPRNGDRRTSRVRRAVLAPAGSRARRSAIVLLITRDRARTNRLINSMSDLSEGALTVLCVNSPSKAIQRLNINESIDAVILDCDLPAPGDFDSLLALIDAAPHVPIIVLGDERSLLQRMSLVEHGAQDYLLKRRLNAETLVSVVYIAIARKSWHSTPFCDRARPQSVLRNISDKLLGSDDGTSAF